MAEGRSGDAGLAGGKIDSSRAARDVGRKGGRSGYGGLDDGWYKEDNIFTFQALKND